MTVTNVSVPVISGTARQGQTLSTTNGTWTLDEDYLTYAYQWLRCDLAGANCVDISGANTTSYLLTASDVGKTIRSEVTATEHTAPVGGELMWTPPGYTGGDPRDPANYPGYTVVNIDNGNCRPTLANGVNYFIRFPNHAITDDGGVALWGTPRNVVIVGGEINNAHLHTVPFNVNLSIGLLLAGPTGIVHIEGMWIHGVGVADAVRLSSGGKETTDIRVQGTRIQCEEAYSSGAHPDAFQCWAGPGYWKMDKNTVRSTSTIRTWQPVETGIRILGVDIRRQNWEAELPSVPPGPGSYALWDDAVGATCWPEYHEDIWFKTDVAHAAYHGMHRTPSPEGMGGDAPNGFTVGYPVYNVTGQNINWGVRPDGDWVPDPTLGDATTCGVGYVSPGYQ